MDRRTNAAINGIVGFVVGYLLATVSGERWSAPKLAFGVGTVMAVVAWIGYEKPDYVD